jgi:hypothetical protein
MRLPRLSDKYCLTGVIEQLNEFSCIFLTFFSKRNIHNFDLVFQWQKRAHQDRKSLLLVIVQVDNLSIKPNPRRMRGDYVR